MSSTVHEAYFDQFQEGFFELLEQKNSKVMGRHPTKDEKGRYHYFDTVGSVEVEKVTQRLQPTNLQDVPHAKRVAEMHYYAAYVSIDDYDKIQMLSDPTSVYATKITTGQARQFDTSSFKALYGTASTGLGLTGTADLDSGNKIAHNSEGFTIAKFHQAVRILEEFEVDTDSDEVVCYTKPSAIEDMFTDSTHSAQFASFDYRQRKMLDDNGEMTFRGVVLCKTNRIPDITSGTTRRALMCTRDSLSIGINRNLKLETVVRGDLSNAIQLSSKFAHAQVRTEEDSVVEMAYQ